MYAIRVEISKVNKPIVVVDLDIDEVYYVPFVRLLGLVTVKSIPTYTPPEQFKSSRIWVEAEHVEF